MHTPDKARFQTQVPDPRNRVRNRTTRGQRAFPHRIIEQLTTALLNQLHHPLLDAHLVQKRIVALGQDIDHGIPDADNLVGFAHRFFSSNWHRSRMIQVPHRGLRALQV